MFSTTVIEMPAISVTKEREKATNWDSEMMETAPKKWEMNQAKMGDEHFDEYTLAMKTHEMGV